MNLPDQLLMREALHGHGGMQRWIYVYRDTEGLGVSHTITGAPRDFWEFDWLPGQQFASFAALRTAVSAADGAAIEAEKAKWPQIVSREPDTCDNRCRLCRAPAPSDRVHIQMAPQPSADDWHFSLCVACQPKLAEGAAAMVARLEAEVAARRARSAEKLEQLRAAPMPDDFKEF